MPIKLSNSIKAFLSAVLAGISISIGVIVYCTCSNKIVGAVLFSIGLMSVLFFKLSLFTGKIGYIESFNDAYDMAIIILGNGVGSVFSFIVPIENAKSIVESKLDSSLIEVFIRAIICGIIIYICVEVYKRYNLWQICLVGVPVFILCKAEHSIADIGFMMASRECSSRAFIFIIVVILGNAVGSIAFHRALKYIGYR